MFHFAFFLRDLVKHISMDPIGNTHIFLRSPYYLTAINSIIKKAETMTRPFIPKAAAPISPKVCDPGY